MKADDVWTTALDVADLPPAVWTRIGRVLDCYQYETARLFLIATGRTRSRRPALTLGHLAQCTGRHIYDPENNPEGPRDRARIERTADNAAPSTD